MAMQFNHSIEEEFESAVKYIESTPKFTKKNTPQVTRKYLDLLGEPDQGMHIIHVAGTNGKGSVCCYLTEILRGAGYSVGMFSSPHLVDIRERMSVNTGLIDRTQFLKYYVKVREISGEEGLPYPAYFEFLFFIAMLWFQEQKVDYVVLETGLGGRLDATNVVREKDLCVITKIGYDHTQYLGNRLREIASEKAGIIRYGVPVVYLDGVEEVSDIIRWKSEQEKAPSTAVSVNDYSAKISGKDTVDFKYALRSGREICAKLRTPALYQAQNAALAVRSIEVLMGQMTTTNSNARRIHMSEDAMTTGLENASWPGRMEEVMPDVWLDGAHNSDGITAFLDSVSHISAPEGGKRILIFSAVRDKDFHEELKLLADAALFDVWITVPMEGERSLSGDELRLAVKEAGAAGVLVGSVKDTKEAILQIIVRKEPEDQIFVAGSLYLVGEFKNLLQQYAEDIRE